MNALSDRRRIGKGLHVTTAIAACLFAANTCIMFQDWDTTSYTASWVNAILGFYCWVTFWTGIILSINSRSWRIVFAVILTLGIAVFVLSGIGELTK